ncbi:hypothetical protein IMSHALPRED_004805 [Imshaugia aleurites]|uniref:Uncharacterized protein n=1 Tax=Imshaugia aleurites TaxID=172621 RepID=A0A8H3F8R7_9LECA|nr:hypothetical protein IMSHALPRED_004805 [Imshaugia aleurites]
MGRQDPQLQTSDGSGDRPRVNASGSTSKYKPGDEVYLNEPGSRSLSGPYLISSVPKKGKYVLCFENGDKVKNGNEVSEGDLKKA